MDSYFLVRLFLCPIFVMAAIGQLKLFQVHLDLMKKFHVPGGKYSLALVILVELVAPVFLISGVYVSLAALVLASYTFVTTCFFYTRWFGEDLFWFEQAIQLFKNVAILGALFAVILMDPSRPEYLNVLNF